MGVYTHNVKSSPDVGLNRYLENECLFAVKKLVWARLAGRTLERAGRSGNGKLVEAHDRITVPGRWNLRQRALGSMNEFREIEVRGS